MMSSSNNTGRFAARHAMAALLAAGTLALAAAPAQAQVPGVDAYLGVGVGVSNADISADDLEVPEFDKKDVGWKAFIGLRASVIGAELEYIDFGKPNGDTAAVKYKGLAAFGLFYAPLPLPFVDIYAKAGLAKVDADLQVDASSFSTKDTKFAYGAGVQVKFGSFALRGEYEQFKLEGAKPSLLSVSFSKSFL
jgi:opacity protein-like surface antigen